MYSINLGRGSKRKEWGKVVGKVVSHKSRTWFKEERKGAKVLVQKGKEGTRL